MKVVTHAQFVPGVCLICGGSDSDREWFLDIEKSAEFWGNIYFCDLCCGTMVYLFRCGDVSAYHARIYQLESIGTELFERLKIHESALAALDDVPRHNSDEFASILVHQNPAPPEPELGVSVQPAGARLVESSDDEGMAELSSFNFVKTKPDTNTGW